MPDPHNSQSERTEIGALSIRGIFGGILMGLANLVPGISGGTMLLASGVYTQFVRGIAEVSTFTFNRRSLILLACVVGAALVTIVALAGSVSHLVIHYRWVMYSIFIGLTLGGVPILLPMIKRLDGRVLAAALVGLIIMAAMALFGPSETVASVDGSHPYVVYFLAGLIGASAMVLPGISGAYLLLILGQYVAILDAVDAAKVGAKAGDWSAVGQAMHVIVPVGLGVVVGVVGSSNVIKWLLDRYHRTTLGFLLGLVVGAVLGLWPFQESVPPQVGDVINQREIISQEQADEVKAKYWKSESFQPALWQIGGALGLLVLGFGASVGVSHIGRAGGDKSAS